MFVQGYVYKVCKCVPVYLGKGLGLVGGKEAGCVGGRALRSKIPRGKKEGLEFYN